MSSELFIRPGMMVPGDAAAIVRNIAASEALFRKGNIGEAAQLAQKADLPLIQARVHIAYGDPSAALGIRQKAQAKGRADTLLLVMAVQSIALYANGEKEKAVELLGEVLARAEPEDFIRLFLNEGDAMAQLLLEATSHAVRPNYIGKLLVAFEAEKPKSEEKPDLSPAQPLVEPLSERELEVLRLLRSD